MYNKIVKYVKNIEKKTFKTMIVFFKFSFLICLFSTFILLSYILNPISPLVFEVGLLLCKISISFFAFTFACGFWVDYIKKYEQ